MNAKNHLMAAMALILLFMSCMSGYESKDIADPVPADRNASPETRAVLSYITALSKDTIPGVISGQNCYHGNEITSAHELNGFENMVGALQQQTGQWVGIIGVDYEFNRIFSPAQLSAANAVLIDYWNRGGLITINWAPHNPWVNDESDIFGNPGTWDGPGCTRDQTDVDLKELTDPSSAIHAIWRKKLDRIATALTELRDAGVVVLWRPMQEMNGNWFWWGMKSHPTDPEPYIRLFRDMFHYFSEEKGLNNLLWVYSPNQGDTMLSGWNRPVEWAYPGDEYVDIVAGTSYNDKLDIKDYKAYLSLGKPLGMGEFGPDLFGDLVKDGSFDNTIYAKRLLADYKRIAYWVSWHSFPGECWSLITNRNASELLNDPGVINRDRLNWGE